MAQAASRNRKLKKRRDAEAMACIEARGLRKAFGTTIALDGVDLRVEEGRILGIIGPNGAGKTTALNAILGLTSYEGKLTVLGRDPWNAREELMRDVSFIADVAVLPRWIRVSQMLDYVAGVHPRFDRTKAEEFLSQTTIKRGSKVRELSKGMVTQLHLALVMAMDAKLLVLDEPYFEVLVHPEQVAAARALKPIHERQVFGRSILLFERVERQQLAALGEVRTPSIADLFVAVLSNQSGAAQGAGR